MLEYALRVILVCILRILDLRILVIRMLACRILFFRILVLRIIVLRTLASGFRQLLDPYSSCPPAVTRLTVYGGLYI